MDSYDDFERFKKKTDNQSIDFKDFSIEKQKYEVGNNSIISQLYQKKETSSPLARATHTSNLSTNSVGKGIFNPPPFEKKESDFSSDSSIPRQAAKSKKTSYQLIDELYSINQQKSIMNNEQHIKSKLERSTVEAFVEDLKESGNKNIK